jgi:hypothetical protein
MAQVDTCASRGVINPATLKGWQDKVSNQSNISKYQSLRQRTEPPNART